MAYTASKVLQIAAGEIGYKEKKSNSQLDNKTANAGSANYTKYARDFDQKYPAWYNGKKQTASEIVVAKLKANLSVDSDSVRIADMTSLGKDAALEQFTVEVKFK